MSGIVEKIRILPLAFKVSIRRTTKKGVKGKIIFLEDRREEGTNPSEDASVRENSSLK